jgi:phage/plasmid-associated DNA primase
MKGLTQELLESTFSTYSGQKLIVEFNEISNDSKKITNKIKNLVYSKYIYIRKMRQDAITVENIAWFFMTSNDLMPIRLDSRDSGNRRFTIIKT